jgi:cytochrome P450/NADPH-cytochrome P450 reductase
MDFSGKTVVVVSTCALINELSDESRFKKKIGVALEQVRNLVSDGLFTVSDRTIISGFVSAYFDDLEGSQ